MSVDLKAERLNRGFSIAAAAKEIGVSHETLQRAESGERVPHPRNAFRIASFYGVKVTDAWPLEEPDVGATESAA